MATLIKRYGMFTTNGNKMVGRIAEAGKKLAAEDGCGKNAWAFAYSLMDSIASELSPENLHCDGEAPIAYVRSKLKQLNTVQAELETYCLNNWLETPHSMDNAY